MGKLKFKMVCSIFIIICILFSETILFISGHNKSAYTEYLYMNNVSLRSNNSKVYLIGTSGNKINIKNVYPDNHTISFLTTLSPSSYKLQGNTLVTICSSQSDTEIYIFDINKQILNVINIPKFLSLNTHQYAFDGTYFYYIDNINTIRKLSTDGKLIAEYKSERNIQTLTYDNNFNIYVLCDKGMYELKDNLNLISDSSYFSPVKFLNNNYFVDSNNFIYCKNNNTITHIGTFDGNTVIFGGIVGDYIITSENNTIYAIHKTTCEKIKSFSANESIENMCVIDNKIFVLSYSEGVPEILTININEFKDIKKKTGNDIKSDVYKIDSKNKIIYGIPPNTTVAKFKKNISYNGYDISFVRFDNKVLDSGKIGTNATVTFKNDKETFTYKLSVISEVTGEGNHNSRDIKAVMRYILGSEKFNYAQLLAIDFNKNGEPDIVDLAYVVEFCGE